MTAQETVRAIEKFGVKLFAAPDRKFVARGGKMTPEIKRLLEVRRDEIWPLLEPLESDNPTPEAKPPPDDDDIDSIFDSAMDWREYWHGSGTNNLDATSGRTVDGKHLAKAGGHEQYRRSFGSSDNAGPR